MTSATCAASASGEPSPLVTATVRAPQLAAQSSVSTISSVRPDWLIATASTPDRSRFFLYVVATEGEASVASRPAWVWTR